jgi:predicted nucleotidyltransferase
VNAVPDPYEVAAAITKAVEPFRAQLESVMLHGSVVRGDFWPGQSDIDVMIVGRAEDAPLEIEAPLRALGATFTGAYEVELHRCSLTTVTTEKGRPFDQRWIQFGLHGFDLKGHHLVCHGSDQFGDIVLAPPGELRNLALTRVGSLFEMVRKVRDPEQMYKWACEALKATQIYFATREGKDPTRDKRYVFENFMAHVPDFTEKPLAEPIWQHYREGKRRTDPEHLDLCDRFVGGAWGALEKARAA